MTTPPRRHLLASTPDELATWLAERGQPTYRARQIRQWLFRQRADSLGAMANLPKALREQLAADFDLFQSHVVHHRQAADGTEKLVLELRDGGRIECVLLRDGERRSVCLSSQVGCAMGCVFCASGLDGVERDLTAGEIIEQALRLAQLLPLNERLSHVVMMGMGEPLANLNNVLAALRDVAAADGLGISPRRITVSTVGLPAAIRRLADEDLGFNLAVSLHAADDDLRNQLVPVNQRIGLAALLAEADYYFEKSGRRLTFEYVLLGGVNDRAEDARRLAALLRGRIALLNVIPYNAVAGLPYATPSQNAQRRFREILADAGLNVQFRERKGDEIAAACGQLRRSLAPAQTSV